MTDVKHKLKTALLNIYVVFGVFLGAVLTTGNTFLGIVFVALTLLLSPKLSASAASFAPLAKLTSNSKAIFAASFIVFVLGVSQIPKPADSSPLAGVESYQQLSELIDSLRSQAELNNESIRRCGSSCVGKSVFAKLEKPRTSSTKFKGDELSSWSLVAGGIEFKPLNMNTILGDSDGVTRKITAIEVDLGVEKIELPTSVIEATTFEITGEFIENHFANDDVVGYILSVQVDKALAAELEAERVAAAKKAEQRAAERAAEDAKREAMTALLAKLEDGKEYKYYGWNNKDNTVDAKTAEALCERSTILTDQAEITAVAVYGSRAHNHIIRNGGSVTKDYISWFGEGREGRCSAAFTLSGIYEGTQYKKQFYVRPASFKKSSNTSVIVTYAQ